MERGPGPTRARHRLALVCGLGFLAALALPWADVALRPAQARDPLRENRLAAPPPALPRSLAETARYAPRLEAWFGDHLGLRDQTLRWRNFLMVAVMRAQPTPTILPGRDGWLFYVGEGVLDDHRGVAPLSERALDAWVDLLAERTQRLRARGIRCVHAIAPDKESLYPERLPFALDPVGPTRLDHLVARVRARGGIELIDLRPALLREKLHDGPGDHVYFPTGTHWTPRGAWAAARELLQALQRDHPAVRLSERGEHRQVALQARHDDSLAVPLYAQDLLARPQPGFEPVDGFRAPSTAVPDTDRGDRVTELAQPGLPRVLLLHDSFGPGLQPYLAEQCARLRCRWVYALPEVLLDEERPDVVVLLWVERGLAGEPIPDVLAAPLVPAERFLAQERVAWTLTDAGLSLDGYAASEPVADAEGAGLALRPGAQAGRIALPRLAVPADARALVRLSITCAQPTVADVFYTARDDASFSRRCVLQLALPQGTRDVCFALPPEFGGGLQIRPAPAPLACVLRALEVRWALSPSAPGGGAYPR